MIQYTIYIIHCTMYIYVYYTRIVYSIQKIQKFEQPLLYSILYCTVGVVQIFVFFFAGGVTGSLHIREDCCKVSAKNNDRYPPANVILCLHLNNSTHKLCSNTWFPPTRFLKLTDCFKLFFCESKQMNVGAY